MVVDFDQFLSACDGLPDQNDAHVIAAALKTQAAVIVTDNLRDFPEELLRRLNLEARSPDAFIADTIALDTGSRPGAGILRLDVNEPMSVLLKLSRNFHLKSAFKSVVKAISSDF